MKIGFTAIDKNTGCFNHGLITGLNRGSLLYPSDDAISVVYLSYLIVDNLSSTSAIQHSLQQRNVAVETIMTPCF